MIKIYFLLLTVFSFSQELKNNNTYEINYELVTSANGSRIITDYILFSTSDSSIYMTKKNFLKLNEKTNITIIKDTNSFVKGEINSTVLVDTKNHFFYVTKNFRVGSLIFTQYAKNKSYKIQEKIINFDWKFVDEIKTIDSIPCKKATTSFRGRNYTAWFSEEIPISDGPYKFSGLPGLLFEIYDSEMSYHWLIKSIKFNTQALEIVNTKINYPVIDIKTSVKFSDEELNNLVKMNQSRLPKGAMSEDLIIKRGGIELIYEWEK